MEKIRRTLEHLKSVNLYRKREPSEGFLNFCSNDYLGLRKHPRVIEASRKALEECLGSGASQLVSGYTEYHHRLEKKLSEFKGTQGCVLFGSGYLANLGTISALVGEGDLVLSDQLNHASIIDGIRLSGARKVVYPHLNYGFVEDFLRRNRHSFKDVLIVTDSLFSMDGDTADLEALFFLAEKYDAYVYIDEAHATGTLGKGRGLIEEQGLRWNERIVVMGTLSKALGSYGAFVCGSSDLIEFLVNRARSLIFSTSLPPALCAGALEAIRIIEENPSLVDALRQVSRGMAKILSPLPFEVRFHDTPIIPVVVKEEKLALDISRRLRERRILIQAIRYPTVPRGEARLRVTASLTYSAEDLEKLKEALTEVIS